MGIVNINSRINKFIEHGFTKEQAEFLIEEIENEDSTKIKIDVEVIKRIMVTKSDLAEMKTDILKWMIPLSLTVLIILLKQFLKY